MLALIKKKDPYEKAAQRVYAALLERVRAPVFYTALAVPDTFTGRFDLLVLHMFFVVNRLAREGQAGLDFNQALFDVAFADMDQTLREGGIGDMGVPKHMRRMMKAFNGRVHAYNDSLQDDARLAESLARNVYALTKTPPEALARMKNYVHASVDLLEKLSLTDMLAGGMFLPAIESI